MSDDTFNDGDERLESGYLDDEMATGEIAVVDSGRPRRGRHARTRTKRRRILLVSVVVIALVGSVVGWYEAQAHPFGPIGRSRIVHVMPGQGVDTVLTALAHDDVISTTSAFKIWEIFHGHPPIISGYYQFFENEPFTRVATTLGAGPDVHVLTVYPGYSVNEIDRALVTVPGTLIDSFAAALKTQRSDSMLRSNPPYEGLLGVGRYYIVPGETATSLLAQMIERFAAEAKSVGLTPQSSVNGFDAYQVVTIASIAQKEGYYTRYFGDVARVVYNRLSAGMRLAMTATVLYSLNQDGGSVTSKDLQLDTPYNTYLHSGLTPTPICMPSLAALKAALDPPQGSWLYFDLVTAKKGTMVFSSTYAGQLAAQAQAVNNGVGQPAASTMK